MTNAVGDLDWSYGICFNGEIFTRDITHTKSLKLYLIQEGKGIEIRFAVLEDGESCNEFYNNYYKNRRTLKQWKWEFASFPFHESTISYVLIEEEGKILGTQALIQIRMINKNGVFWTAKSEETLLAYPLLGKGLLGEMYKLVFEYAKRKHFIAIWGFTDTVKPFTKIKFQVSVSTNQLWRPFSAK